MSRVATRSTPVASREEESRQEALRQDEHPDGLSGFGARPQDGASRDASLLNTLTALVEEAHTVTDLRRPGMVGAINAVLARLPSEADPGAAAAVLQRLLAEGRLEDLVDEEGQRASLAATGALLELGYPHALEVTPEQLEALRRWKPLTPPVPWFGLTVTLFLAFVAQVFFITMGTPSHPFPMMSVEALAGGPVPERTWLQVFRTFVWDTSLAVTAGQILSNFAAFLLAVSVGWHYRGHRVARRVFLGLGVAGLVVGSLQLTASAWLTWATGASAAGSLLCGWLMKKKR
ncbi:hypothetical protein ACLESD_23560 [Pyxidicoccus sp. 3LFB2]